MFNGSTLNGVRLNGRRQPPTTLGRRLPPGLFFLMVAAGRENLLRRPDSPVDPFDAPMGFRILEDGQG